jgi:hypothetical protein
LNGASFSDSELGSHSIGLKENDLSNDFYPNPFVDQVFFKQKGLIVDMNGRIVMNVVEGINNLQYLASGVYTYLSETGLVSMMVKK